MLYDFAFSKQGYNHIKVDKVCEDASESYSDELMSIAVVADGHGSDNHPRTEHGSYFAVKAAIDSIQKFVQTVEQDGIDITSSSDEYMEQLAKNILAHWYGNVEYDLVHYPFTEKELEKVADKYKKRYLSGERTEKAYGTTLIAVCETAKYWFGLQIGDGKCVCIMPDGSIQEPIPWDDECQSNVTTSICDSEAIDEFRYCFLDKDRRPIATFIGTDGIDDSYANSNELHSLYRSIFTIFVEHGTDVGSKEVEEFLPGLTRKGSGDDVSIAGLVTPSISKVFLSLLKAQCEYAQAKDAQHKLEREVVLAEETREYVISALQKAKASYEEASQKADDADAAVISAKKAYSDALQRYEQATIDLNIAMNAYHQETDAANHTLPEMIVQSTSDVSDRTGTVESSNAGMEQYPEAMDDEISAQASVGEANTLEHPIAEPDDACFQPFDEVTHETEVEEENPGKAE